MRYSITFAPSAARDMRALDDTSKRRIGNAIDALSDEPRPHGVKKLRGEANIYRLRVGDYRVLYQIADRQLVVLVVRIRHRRDAYR